MNLDVLLQIIGFLIVAFTSIYSLIKIYPRMRGAYFYFWFFMFVAVSLNVYYLIIILFKMIVGLKLWNLKTYLLYNNLSKIQHYDVYIYLISKIIASIQALLVSIGTYNLIIAYLRRETLLNKQENDNSAQ